MTQKQRRTQAERSAQTREKILKATIDILVEQGMPRLTTALVDQRAGISSGARVHHFPSKIDLVVAATEQAYASAAEIGRKRALSARSAANPLREYAADCLSVYFEWPFIAALEVVVSARTDVALMDRLKPVLDGFHRAMKTTWTESLVAAGYPQDIAEEELSLTLNLIRGMAINKIWQHDAATYIAAIDKWCEERLGLFRLLDSSRAAETISRVQPQ